MKLASAILGLFVAASASLPALAAVPASPAPDEIAAAIPVKAVQHRHGPAGQRWFAPAGRSDGAYDWGHWSRSYHPGWPCVSGDSSTTSAYPTWEARPNCR